MDNITIVFKLGAINLEDMITGLCEKLKSDGKIGTINRLPGETQHSPFLIVLVSSDGGGIFCQLSQIVQDGSTINEDRLLIGDVADRLIALGGYLTIEVFTQDAVLINVVYDIIANIVKEFGEVYWLSLGELLPVPTRRSFQGMCAGRGCIL